MQPENPDTTFLTALRHSKAKLSAGCEFNSFDLYKKVGEALKLARINTPTNLKILKEWYQDGTYTIAGEKHEGDGKGGVSGAYAELAAKITEKYHPEHKEGSGVGINEAISYSLGSKHEMAEIKNDDEAYAHVQNALNSPNIIWSRINSGNIMRRTNIWARIEHSFSNEEIYRRAGAEKEARAVAEKIVKYFPAETLELMLRKDESYVYSNSNEVRSVYPLEDPVGEAPEYCEQTRQSSGGRILRFRTTFVTNGNRDLDEQITDDIKYQRVAHTLLHETGHIAFDNMTDEEQEHIYRLVDQVSAVLKNGSTKIVRPSFAYEALGEKASQKMIWDRSLAETLDYSSVCYDGYTDQFVSPKSNSPDMRREEVMCNLFGYLYTEFTDRNDPANPLFYPPKGMEVIRELALAVDAAYKKGVERLREQQEAKGIELPGAPAVRSLAAS